MSRLAGKIAIVTGAANGMGRATAELFAEHGARVVAGDIAEPAEPLSGEHIDFVNLDVTSEQGWQRAVDETESRYGKVDVLVNNAGIIAYQPVDELGLADWAKVVDVNQTGVFLGIRQVVPAMRRAGGGSVINFSSIWGNVAVAGAAAYHASKGAVRNLSKNAAMTYATENIRVNSVHPGIIHTPLVDRQDDEVNKQVVASTPMARMGQPREIANGVLFLASDESSFMTGAELVIDGGYTAQ